jgi:PAS domain S-box-containing protein
MRDIFKAVLDRPFVRYALAVVVVAASFLLRYFLVQGLGLAMPPFITFFPAIIIVAVLAGLGPGLLATALAALAVDYFILPPYGFGIASISDAVALVLFATMGILISQLAESYRRSLLSIAAYKVEQTLWVSNEKLDVALASMTDAVFISDAKGQFIQFNDAFATFHRFRNKSECVKTLAEYPEFLEVSMADGQLVPLEMWAVPRALRGETATNEEYRLRRKDTGETWIGSYSFGPVRDHEGAIIGSVVVGRDITEQKRAEEALRKSETLYHGLFDSMNDGFCIIEMIFDSAGKPADYRFLEINAAFEKQTGMHDAVGKRMRELALSHEEYWFEIYGKIALTGEPAHFLNEAKALNRYYEVSAYRVGESALRQVAIVFNDISVRMHTEEALKRSMEQLQIFVEHAPAALAMFDLDMRYICASHRWSADYGLGDRDLRGVSHYDVFPEIPERWKEAHRRVRAGEVVQAENDSFVRADGSLQRLRWEIHPWHEPSGEIGGIVVFTEDITERKRAEEHIRQLNRVYAVLSDINQMIVREKDSQTMLEAACRIATEKGKFRMAWIGMVDSETHALKPIASSGEVGDYLDRVRIDLLAPARTTGPSGRCFLSGEHAVSNAIEQDPLFAPWRDDALRMGYRSHASFPLKVDAQVVGIFNLYSSELAFFDEDEIKLLDELAMDIGFALEVNRREEDRRKAEEELRWRTAFFEAQVDSAQDGVLVVDSKGKKILQNRRMNELLKIPQHVSENRDNPPQLEYVATLMKNPGQFVDKVNYLTFHPEKIDREEIELLDGTILEEYSSPVWDKERNYYGRIWILRDITERRQLEEQFRQAQKMEAVGQLTGGIAHDFNNLLTVIMGCSEFIGEEAKENPRLSKMAKMILDAAQRGADLTHRMLAFARRQALQPKPIEVNRMLANMESFLRRTLSADIDLEVIQSGEDCTALVDLTQLESALLNLCVNARDAMPAGGKLIVETGIATLDSSYAEQNADVTPGQYILIAVSDTGCGISRENLSRVFDPFFTTKEVGKGTGLGLSMVYGFAKQSYGHVKIYSELGQGTSVKLYLPQADPECEPSNQEATLIVDLQGSEIILLVEDNAPVREFAKTQLLHLGYQVLEAANGKDALAILKGHQDIDLLFTDVVMPGGLNGRELAHEARMLYPELKVLFCSGYAESAILHLGLLDEHVQLLNKPYSRLQLARRIREMLTASQSAPEEKGRNA